MKKDDKQRLKFALEYISDNVYTAKYTYEGEFDKNSTIKKHTIKIFKFNFLNSTNLLWYVYRYDTLAEVFALLEGIKVGKYI